MTDTQLLERIDNLTAAVQMMSQILGTRLSRTQLCERLGIHRNTLPKRLVERCFPKPDRSGKWLLSEVIEWERLR